MTQLPRDVIELRAFRGSFGDQQDRLGLDGHLSGETWSSGSSEMRRSFSPRCTYRLKKPEIFFRNIVENGFSAAFRAFQLGKFKLSFLRSSVLKSPTSSLLQLGAGERDVNGFDQPPHVKFEIRLICSTIAVEHSMKSNLVPLAWADLEVLDPGFDADGVDPRDFLGVDDQFGGRRTDQLIEVHAFLDGSGQADHQSGCLFVLYDIQHGNTSYLSA